MQNIKYLKISFVFSLVIFHVSVCSIFGQDAAMYKRVQLKTTDVEIKELTNVASGCKND
jgi:hypothetical protein